MVTVREAATVMLVRDDPDLQVFMLRRNLESTWVAGAYVFPGGAVDPEDRDPALAARCPGLDDPRASALLGLPAGGLGYWVAAVRETLEEAGARIELGAPFAMISVPYVNQVHVFYRAKLLDLEYAPGEESLEVELYDEAAIPWRDIAFRTVATTLKHWFADRARGAFGFHAEDLVAR
jgi:8-oxo-dGTP pyrophosphatase MutT (NUDIX family)